MAKYKELRGFLNVLVHILAIIGVILPGLTSGNPITKKQFGKVAKLLEEEIAKEFGSDDADQYADIVRQKRYDKKDLTYYHIGDASEPVFVSYGLGHIGKKIHVLLRGEDYINPRDRNNFVVLRQMSSDAESYSVHLAHILNMKNIEKSGVLWNDARVEQQKNLKGLLSQVGNQEVQARSLKASRPLCDWMGGILLCDNKKYNPPVRPRVPRIPLDKEDPSPRKAPSVVSEEKEMGIPGENQPSKRNIGSGYTSQKLTQADKTHSSDASEEEKLLVLKSFDFKDEDGPAVSSTEKPVEEESSPAPPVDAAPPPEVRVAEVSGDETSKSKKKNKKKRKTKPKEPTS